MGKLTIITAFGIFAMIILNGCDYVDQSTPAYFEIISKTDGTTNSGMYYIELEIKNTGGGSGKNVICQISVKDMESEKVYGSTSTIFNEGNNIKAGETAKSIAVFPESGFLDLPTADFTTGEEEPNILFYSYELTWEDVTN